MYDLSNFYNDYSVDAQSYQDIFKIYEDIINIICDYANQVTDNALINKTETYRTVPVQYVRIDEATYDLASTINNSVTIRDKYGIDQLLTTDMATAFWNTLTNDQKVDILDTTAKYILITVARNTALDSPTPQVVDFEFYDDSNTKLSRNYDYVLQNNKIYLINLDISTPTENMKYCLRKISIDMSTPQKLLSSRMGIDYNEAFTKPEFTQIMQVLIYGALGGPTIANMKQALSSIVQLADIKIFDKFNADELRKGYWNQDGSSAIMENDKLTDFDFLISVPSSFANNTEKLNLFKTYLNIIKPSYTNFVMSVFYPFLDSLSLKASENIMGLIAAKSFSDVFNTYSDSIPRKAIGTMSDSITTLLKSASANPIVISNVLRMTDLLTKADSWTSALKKSDLTDKIIGIEIETQLAKTGTSDSISNLGMYFLCDYGSCFDSEVPLDYSTLTYNQMPGNNICDTVNVKYYQ